MCEAILMKKRILMAKIVRNVIFKGKQGTSMILFISSVFLVNKGRGLFIGKHVVKKF